MESLVKPSGITESHDHSEANVSKTQFQNVTEYAEWKIRGTLGIYSPDSPVAQYAQHTLQKLNGSSHEHMPQITVYKGEPNAFVFPSGSIYLSDKLLELADNEEEILFVLMHEKIHHQEAHSEKVFGRAEEEERKLSDLVFGGLGQARIHEWEGDLRAFTELDKLGINPMGGIEMLEKFRTDPKLGGGLVHGKTTDRALNLRAMTYLRDLPSLDTPLHVVSPEIKSAIAQEQIEKKFNASYGKLMSHVDSISYHKAKDVIESMDLNQALVALQAIALRYKKDTEMSAIEGRRYKYFVDFEEKIMPILGKRIWDTMADSMTLGNQIPSRQEVTVAFHTILELTIGISPKMQGKNGLLNGDSSSVIHDNSTNEDVNWNERNFSLGNQLQTKDDVKKALGMLDPTILEQLGLKVAYAPDRFIENITQSIMDNFVFEDDGLQVDEFLSFTKELGERLTRLYKEEGTIKFELPAAYRKVIRVARDNIEKNDALPLLIAATELGVISSKKSNTEEKKQITEQESNDKLLNTFKTFLKDYKQEVERDSDKFKYHPIKNRNVAMQEDLYLPQLQEIIQERQIQTPEELVVFIANFRKTIQGDKTMWDSYLEADSNWTLIMKKAINQSFGNSYSFPNSAEKLVLDFKLNLLLSHDWTAESIEAPGALWDIHDDPHFDLEMYKTLYGLATDERYLARETGVDTQVDTVVGMEKNDRWDDFLKEGKIVLLSKAVKSFQKEEFSNLLELLTNEFPFNHYGNEKNVDVGIQEDYHAITSKRQFLNDAIKTFSFDLSNAKDSRNLYYLSTYLEDQSLAVRLQNVIWEKLSNVLTFEEGFAFLETEIQAKRLLSLKAVSDFVEKSARTHEEIEMAREKLIGMLTQDSSLESIGKLVATEQLVTQFFLNNKYEFLLACVGNGDDDSYLKKYLYRSWVDCMDYDQTETKNRIHLNDMMHRLYRLDAQSKYVLIRDLLTGDKGVLTSGDVNTRLEFVDFFLDNYIEVTGDEDKKFFRVIKDVMRQVVKTANYDLLYFAISPILQDRMLIPPENQVSWLDIIRTEEPPLGFQKIQDDDDEIDEYDDDEDDFDNDDDDFDEDEAQLSDYTNTDYYDLDEHGQIYGERIYGKRTSSAENTSFQQSSLVQEEQQRQIVDEEEVDKLFKYITGSSEEQIKTNESNQVRREYEDVIEGLLQGEETKPAKQKMTVNEFLLETSQKLGAPGVRFLQLIGQYVELPAHLEQSFNQVYDKVSGQSKMTADQTLLREWPQAREQLTGLTERLGGGSLMSVFKATTAQDQDVAIKVLNPNSSHHTETTNKLLTQVFDVLAEQNVAFAPATTLLADIREWIKGDINFEGFLEKDKRFRKKHNGYTSKGNRYKIKVPVSYLPENKYFAVEDFVEGINLTDIGKLQEQGHDTKQIVSILTKNFFDQVKDGQVHSDIHPGNIRITANNEVVYLDRNYYLQFDLRDKLFLRGLSGSLNNTDRATEMCIDYIQSQGTQVNSDKRKRIIEQARSLDIISDPTDKLMSLAVLLRKEGLRFPIKTTLLVKDFFYLDRLAKKVGFTGIADAMQGKQ